MLLFMAIGDDQPPIDSVDASSLERGRPQNLLEVHELQKLAAPIALDLLLLTLDQCRFLLDSAKSPQADAVENKAAKRYGSGISTRERKELDKVIDETRNNIQEKGKLELERLAQEGREAKGFGGPVYPVAEETVYAIAQMVFAKINQEVAGELLAKYKGDRVKLEYILSRIRIGAGDRTELLLGASLVPMIVSKIEEFVAALLRVGLGVHPKGLGDLPSIPNEIFQRYQANIPTADIVRWQIDQKIDSLMSGSPTDWQRVIERWARIDITSIGADWDILVELIQRRHAIVHANARVDLEYLDRVAPRLTHGLVLGSYLTCNSAYLEPVLIELETWATCLTLRWVKHFFRDDGINFPLLESRVMNLEILGRWTQALTILDCLLMEPLPSDENQLAVAQINRYFCLQELGRDNEALRREIQSMNLDGEKQGLHRAARYALLYDYPELLKELRAITEGPHASATKRDVSEMPLFERAAKNSTQIRNFLLVGGMRPARGVPPIKGHVRRRRR